MITQAVSEAANTVVLQSAEALQATIQGQLLFPHTEGYDQVRQVWNAMVDKKPACIVRCAIQEDVIQAVNFARTHSLLVSVRGGGHNVAGNAVCEGGMMIRLNAFKSTII